MILDDADHPAVEGGVYVIPYNEAVDGYWHAFRKGRKVQYSRSWGHPADPRCPECNKTKADA
jgi:hypothetical protein